MTDVAITFQASVDRFVQTISERVVPMFRRLDRALLGPKAPPRKRPRRVAKRIEQRHGRLRFSPFNIGCKRPRSAS